jgi:hypothetical protein
MRSWLEWGGVIITSLQVFISSQTDALNVLAMSLVAGLGQYIVSINRRDADKIAPKIHRRVAALRAFMALVLGSLLVGAQFGNFWIRFGLAGFIALMDQALAMQYLSKAANAAMPVLNTSSLTSSDPGPQGAGLGSRNDPTEPLIVEGGEANDQGIVSGSSPASNQ